MAVDQGDLETLAKVLSEMRDTQVPPPAPGKAAGTSETVMPVGGAIAVDVGRGKFGATSVAVKKIYEGWRQPLENLRPNVPDDVDPGATDGQEAPSGQLVPDAPAVRVTSTGEPVNQAVVVFSLADGNGTLVNGGAHEVVLTDIDGVARCSGWRLAENARGRNELRVQVNGRQDLTITITGKLPS